MKKETHSKKIGIISHKFVILSQLLTERIEDYNIDLKIDTNGVQKSIITLLELVTNDIADCDAVRKSSYFQKLTDNLILILHQNPFDEKLDWEQHDIYVLINALAETLNELKIALNTTDDLIPNMLKGVSVYTYLFFSVLNLKEEELNKIYTKDTINKINTMMRKNYDHTK